MAYMAIKTQINAVLNKEMDRKDFIKHLAVGAVALAGLGWALRLLADKRSGSADNGYSSAAYGDAKGPQAAWPESEARYLPH